MNLPTQEISNTEFDNFPQKNIFFRKIFFWAGVLFLILISTYYLFFSAPTNFPEGVVVSIEPGENLRELSLDLKEKKIIRSRVSFETFIIAYGGEKRIAVGDYLFENKLPVFEVARRIAQKDRRLASVKITVPEGFDNYQIGDLASKKLKNFNREKFLAKAKAKEGYLFPDTYFFFSSDNEEDVIKYMIENFERKIKTVESERISFEKPLKETIIMASLIEREAKGDADRGYIAGILWNRIKKKMPLQVDASPETYKKKGLPENPICNPGLESIKASIHPIASNYLYYLHDKNGKIYYAETFAEHKINKLKYLK